MSPKRGELEEGGFLNSWAQREELPGLAGATRHLIMAVIDRFEGELVVVKSETAGVACGLKFSGTTYWDLESEAPKCPECQRIAEADQDPSTNIPIKRPRELVEA